MFSGLSISRYLSLVLSSIFSAYLLVFLSLFSQPIPVSPFSGSIYSFYVHLSPFSGPISMYHTSVNSVTLHKLTVNLSDPFFIAIINTEIIQNYVFMKIFGFIITVKWLMFIYSYDKKQDNF